MAAVTSVAVGAAAIGVGAYGQYKAGKSQAKASQQAADTEIQIARESLKAQEQARKDAVQLAQPSMAELASIERIVSKNEAAYKNNLLQVDKQIEMLDTVDPTIKEAGKQTLELLKGQEARILEPLRQERTRQKRDLENQLASRLGPGWRTSSSGIEAMTRFDDATSQTLISAQSQALNQVGNLFSQMSGTRNQGVSSLQGIFNQNLAGDSTVLQGQQNIQNRQVGAFTGNAPNTYGSVIQAAGNSQNGAILNAQNTANIYGTLGQLGGTALGYGIQQNQPSTLGDMNFGNSKPNQYSLGVDYNSMGK